MNKYQSLTWRHIAIVGDVILNAGAVAADAAATVRGGAAEVEHLAGKLSTKNSATDTCSSKRLTETLLNNYCLWS
jgi:catalase (peroxidase I)